MWVFFAVAVGGGLALGLYRESQRRTQRRRSPASPLSHALPDDVVARARERIGEGKPVHAIKELREATGYDLRSAKTIVDALQAGRHVPTLGESAAD
ncbi:hypothetical protein EKD16_13765 [Streptomonospora litoralis]|uniref:Ribosomal protein L7/L12 C-terminal domain-containing protein n=2 Tax=Streptomonospora litoralis TaxID=2498135 RepID=A0A4P6Q1V6_9ACTN|nr:hypothetical protein EKD16_13765 [Streptomonospora litoralis]